MAFDQQKYIDDYVRENYDRLSLKIPKGKKAVLEEKYGVNLSKAD